MNNETMAGVANLIPMIENNFSYHAPKDRQPEKYQKIRDMAKQLALLINELCPYSSEKLLSLTKLDEVVMHANASIARHE